MKNLSHRDVQTLLAALEVLHAEVDPLTLPERTLQAVLSLVPNDIAVFDGFGTDNNYSGYLWYSPADMVWDHLMPVLAELVYQNPVYETVVNDRTTKIVSISHFAPLAKFHRTAVYNEFYRHFDADTQLSACLAVSPELYVTCSLHRAKRDFTDREWKRLEFLAPHLVSAFRNAQFVHKLEIERDLLDTALEAARYGIITVDLDLNIRNQNLTAIKLLHKYFQPLSNNLPEELAGFVKHQSHSYSASEVYVPPAPLILERIDSKLKIRLSFQSQSNTIVLLLEEIKEISPADLVGLGLTKRQAEILFWMAKGKADADISFLCNISRRTVHKHRENIFTKLGVETRTAAMLRAIEFFEKVI